MRILRDNCSSYGRLFMLMTFMSWFSMIFAMVPVRNQPTPMNSGILLKCQSSDKNFPITKANAEKSNFLKSALEKNHQPVIEIAGEYCPEGLQTTVNYMNGEKLIITNHIFINVFPLASRLDIRELHQSLMNYFLKSNSKENLITAVNDDLSQRELEKMVAYQTNYRKYKLLKDWIFDGTEALTLLAKNLEDVTWITDALNTGGLRHLKYLQLTGNKISSFDLNPEYPLSLILIGMPQNRLRNVNSLVRSLNDGKLPNLLSLYLSDNQISYFPISPQHKLKLQTIELDGNWLINADALARSLNEGNLNPEKLDLSGNQIESWSAWGRIHRNITHLRDFSYDFRNIIDFDDIEAIKHAKEFMPNLSIHWEFYINQVFNARSSQNIQNLVLNVKRHDLYRSSKISFLELEHLNLKKIKIRYSDESGQDVGGLTRDFVHQLSLEMVKRKHGIFQVLNAEDDDMRNRRFYFANYNKEKDSDYLFIGRFIAFAYVKRVPLSTEFPSTFYTLLTSPNQKFAFEDFKDFDLEQFRQIEHIKERLDPDELCYYSFCIDNEPISDKYGCDTKVTPENEAEYFDAYANYMIKKRYKGTIEAISKGFREYFDIFHSKIQLEWENPIIWPNPDIIKKILIPAPKIKILDLISHTTFKGFNPQKEHQMKQFYTKMLMEWDETKEGKEKIESLVLFIRGSKLPMTGWRGIPNITFQKRVADGIFLYPVAHTCFYTLDIQPYATKEAFEEGINASLNAFKLSGGIMSIA